MTSVAFLQQDATSETAALLAPHEASLRFLCRELTGNHDDAEDALQETFLRAIRGLGSFRGEAQLKTWLTRIAIRVCLEQRRKQPIALEQLPAPRPHASPETQTLQKFLLQSALSELPPRRRAIFLLKEVEGWSLSEIAEATGTNAPLVKVELYRARKTLQSWVVRQEIQEKRIP
ncbi:RNA polymerase sigma factor [Armatimonas sp.]|uniref:RNA polymerase sigma factor n=1 Tax=Armatimonas sp. TaxID=1872638 RepID=UPI00286CF8B3|nr:RNA polymerase sigma factor [Armatimonas sp.]